MLVCVCVHVCVCVCVQTHIVAQTVKSLPAVQGDPGSISGSRRSPGEGNGNPLQYSCLENPMDRGVWQASIHGVAKSQTHELLTHIYLKYLYTNVTVPYILF